MFMRTPEIIAILVVALLIFGPKRLPEMGSSIAKTMNAFKKGMEDLRNDSSNNTSAEEVKALPAAQIELDAIESELASKKAALAALEREEAQAQQQHP